MAGFVYLIRNGDLHKIGRTDNLERRMKQLKPDEIVQVLETDRSRDLEYELHQLFQYKRLPQSEYFRLSESEVDVARTYLGWDSGSPPELSLPPVSRTVVEARRSAHWSLAAVALTIAGFLGGGYAYGSGGNDLWASLLILASLLGFLTASSALLWFSLRYGWVWASWRLRQ